MRSAFLFSLIRSPAAPLRPTERVIIERWVGAVARWRVRLA
jgi:hypothetical protein